VPKRKPDRLLRSETLIDGVTRNNSGGSEREDRDENGTDGSRARKKQASPGNNFYRARDHEGASSEPHRGERLRHEFHACELRVTGCEKQNTNEYLKGIERDDRHDVPDDRRGRALCNDRL